MSSQDQRRDRDAEIEREIGDHLELERERHSAAGLDDDQARRAARLRFGNPAAVREDVREAQRWRGPERLWLDVRLAVRLWARTPILTLIAVATIGVGVGAGTALIGQVRAVFWTPLPVTTPDDLRIVSWTSPRRPFVAGPNVMAGPTVDNTPTLVTVSYPAYLAMRDRSTTFTDIACWADLGDARPVILGELGFGTVQFVSGNYFRTLGVRPALGRTIEPADQTTTGWSPVVMISHAFWQRTFGGAADVTSRTLTLNGRRFAIVGVMPEGFFGLDPAVTPDLIVPNGAVIVAAATTDPLQNRALWNVCRIVARLAPGRSDEEARLDLERALAASIAEAPPTEPYDPPRVRLLPGGYGLPTLRDGVGTPVMILAIAVGSLLLAACANIAGLLLARGSARGRELATRLALGASRGRLIRQLVTESLVLSAAGAMAGIVLAAWLAPASRALLSQFMPTLFGADRALGPVTALDVRLVAAALAMATLTGLLFGTLPAIAATRLDLMAVIKAHGRDDRRLGGAMGGRAMVAVQTALALVLLVGAGLLLRTLDNLRHADLGFDVPRLLYARVEPRSGGLQQVQRQQFFEEAVARLRALPSVSAAAATGVAPMGADTSVGVGNFTMAVCSDRAVKTGGPPTTVALNAVTSGYFTTLGVAIVAGRDFTPTDRAVFSASASPGNNALIVNESFARTFLGSTTSVGQVIRTTVSGRDCSGAIGNLAIVGVVRDSRTSVRAAPAPEVYAPLGGFSGPVTLVIRTDAEPSSLILAVRRALTDFNANTPTFSEAPVSAVIERHLRRERLLTMLLVTFSAVTVLLCALGIYGLLSYAVERRRQEISVRMAIGAQARDVVRLMVQESLVPVLVGLAAGSLVAVLASRWLGPLLYGVTATDPLVLGGAALLFLAVAALAAALPSRTAAGVDPVLALRQ